MCHGSSVVRPWHKADCVYSWHFSSHLQHTTGIFLINKNKYETEVIATSGSDAKIYYALVCTILCQAIDPSFLGKFYFKKQVNY